MNHDNMHFRHSILYEFWKEKNASDEAKYIFSTYGKSSNMPEVVYPGSIRKL